MVDFDWGCFSDYVFFGFETCFGTDFDLKMGTVLKIGIISVRFEDD